MTADGIVFTGRCVIHGVVASILEAETNDVLFTLHNSLDNSGDQVIPKMVLDASAEHFVGIMDLNVGCNTGCYLDLTQAAGACEIAVYYSRD
jgi:hypothetical protein